MVLLGKLDQLEKVVWLEGLDQMADQVQQVPVVHQERGDRLVHLDHQVLLALKVPQKEVNKEHKDPWDQLVLQDLQDQEGDLVKEVRLVNKVNQGSLDDQD